VQGRRSRQAFLVSRGLLFDLPLHALLRNAGENGLAKLTGQLRAYPAPYAPGAAAPAQDASEVETVPQRLSSHVIPPPAPVK
jgi:hypothetical protein